MAPIIIVLIILVVLVFIALIKTIQVIPQASAAIVERFGRYTRTLNAGLNIVVPFIDSIRNRIDLREQVVPFPPQPVITQDNLVVNIDTVIYYQVTDARAATYEVASYIQAIEQLTVTTLRNIIGGMDLERTLTSREEINATCAASSTRPPASGASASTASSSRRSNRPPPSRTRWRSRCAPTVTSAPRSSPPKASASRRFSPPKVRSSPRSCAPKVRPKPPPCAPRARPRPSVRSSSPSTFTTPTRSLAYQYLQMLPKIAEGDANKLWIVPSEIGDALKGLSGAMGNFGPMGGGSGNAGTERREKPSVTD